MLTQTRVIIIADAVGLAAQLAAEGLKYMAQGLPLPGRLIHRLKQALRFLVLPSGAGAPLHRLFHTLQPLYCKSVGQS